ncbi:hypothetical protein KKG19_05845 [Patescibacteria group bacterium]|nr:hypothetical protein [Patescibacteria group bacterium]
MGEIMAECPSPIEMSNWIPMKTNAYEFAFEVDRQIEALSNEDYHRRVGRSKKLREELYPLSRLALHFKQPGLEVEVQGFVDCGRPDGYIRITGFLNREFEVQITYAAYGCKDALRAQLLVSEGFTPGAGDIQREKKSKRIIATMGSVAHDEHIVRIASGILERFHEKCKKRYAPGTVLLIAFQEVKLYGCTNWHQLLVAIDEKGGMFGSSFAEVYLFNGATNELRIAA